MTLTRELRATLFDRARQDADFQRAILKEGIDTLSAGDVKTGKAILRDYINAAVWFGELTDATNIPTKSLMRMFGPKGNPRADNVPSHPFPAGLRRNSHGSSSPLISHVANRDRVIVLNVTPCGLFYSRDRRKTEAGWMWIMKHSWFSTVYSMLHGY